MNVHENINKYEFIKRTDTKGIVLWGAGNMLYDAYELLSQISNLNVILIIDNSPNKIGQEIFLGKKRFIVQDAEALEKIDMHQNVLLITNKYYKDIIEQCNKIESISEMDCYSFVKINWCENLFDRSMNGLKKLLKKRGYSNEEIEQNVDYYKERRLKKENYMIIPKINVIVTEKCTLKCDKCRALMPEMCNPQEESLQKVIEEIDIILNAVDDIVDFEPIGGEPFIYKHLPEVLEYVCASDKINTVVISTNGTVIPNEKLIKALKNKKVFVNISDYGYIQKMSNLIKCFEDNEIAFEVETDQIWYDVGDVTCRNRDENQLMEEFENCYCQYLVKYIWDKKIWICPRAPRLNSLGITDGNEDYESLCEDDSIEITRKKLQEIFGKKYANACNYCDQGNLYIKYVRAGEQRGVNDRKSQYTFIKRSEYELLKANLRGQV